MRWSQWNARLMVQWYVHSIMLSLAKYRLDDALSLFLLLPLEADFVDTLVACDGD